MGVIVVLQIDIGRGLNPPLVLVPAVLLCLLYAGVPSLLEGTILFRHATVPER